jgi:nicotinate-nucleotide pyrophosphorylase (carboxylating)
VSDSSHGLRDIVRRALEEDRAFDDVTTLATIAPGVPGAARLLAKQPCVVAGLDAFIASFEEMDRSIAVKVVISDGEQARAGATVASVIGPLRGILSAERTALNFIQRLSGIATLTRAFVDEAGKARRDVRPDKGPPLIAIRDTRKTTPLLRDLEKAAVRAGGGSNHRRDLASAILIKDNHVVAAGGLRRAVEAIGLPSRGERLWIELECDTLEHVQEALEAGVDEVLLDNMDVETLRKAVTLVREHAGSTRTEASGGVTLGTVRAIAETGVDSISVGALTHSAPAIDLSLEVEAV